MDEQELENKLFRKHKRTLKKWMASTLPSKCITLKDMKPEKRKEMFELYEDKKDKESTQDVG